MASERQINANRRNARKSAGPSTDGGKQRSSRNNLRHGLYSKDVVLSGEDPNDYLALVAEVVDEFRPATPTEEYLVNTIVTSRWRLFRIVKTQTGIFEDRMQRIVAAKAKSARSSSSREQDPDVAWRQMLSEVARGDALSTNIFEKVSREEDRLHRRVFRAIAELRKLQKARREQDAADEAAADAHENEDSNPIPESDTVPEPPVSPAKPAPTAYCAGPDQPEQPLNGFPIQNPPAGPSPAAPDNLG